MRSLSTAIPRSHALEHTAPVTTRSRAATHRMTPYGWPAFYSGHLIPVPDVRGTKHVIAGNRGLRKSVRRRSLSRRGHHSRRLQSDGPSSITVSSECWLAHAVRNPRLARGSWIQRPARSVCHVVRGVSQPSAATHSTWTRVACELHTRRRHCVER